MSRRACLRDSLSSSLMRQILWASSPAKASPCSHRTSVHLLVIAVIMLTWNSTYAMSYEGKMPICAYVRRFILFRLQSGPLWVCSSGRWPVLLALQYPWSRVYRVSTLTFLLDVLLLHSHIQIKTYMLFGLVSLSMPEASLAEGFLLLPHLSF